MRRTKIVATADPAAHAPCGITLLRSPPPGDTEPNHEDEGALAS